MQPRFMAESYKSSGKLEALTALVLGGDSGEMWRPAQPEELSPAYVFLASPVCASYTTRILPPVTGSVGA